MPRPAAPYPSEPDDRQPGPGVPPHGPHEGAAPTVEQPIPAYSPASGKPGIPPDPTLTRGPDLSQPGAPPPYGPPPGATGPATGPLTPGPQKPNAGKRRLTAALIAIGAAVVLAGVVSLAFRQVGGSPARPRDSCGVAGCASPVKTVAPVVAKFRYRTVERDVGYFEGTVTLVNHGKRPLSTWTLTFTYPGADIHNAWEVVLQGRGQNVTIANAPTAAPIAPGDSFEVRFGGAGRPGMPANCRLNGAPCTFVK